MTADGLSDDDIRLILTQARTVALIGASNKPERPSYQVMAALLAQGYEVYPVNPGLAGQSIHGRSVAASLAGLTEPIDIVDIFRAADHVEPVVSDAIAARSRLGIACVWMQLGIVNLKAASAAAGAGIVTVMDRCPKIELNRLSIPNRGSSLSHGTG
jgi:uncharacterized protein